MWPRSRHRLPSNTSVLSRRNEPESRVPEDLIGRSNLFPGSVCEGLMMPLRLARVPAGRAGKVTPVTLVVSSKPCPPAGQSGVRGEHHCPRTVGGAKMPTAGREVKPIDATAGLGPHRFVQCPAISLYLSTLSGSIRQSGILRRSKWFPTVSTGARTGFRAGSGGPAGGGWSGPGAGGPPRWPDRRARSLWRGGPPRRRRRRGSRRLRARPLP